MSLSAVKSLILWFLLWLAITTPFSTAKECMGSAKYEMTFKADWTAQSHPKDFPSNHRPHFSRLVGCTHSSLYVMWDTGEKATPGFRLVAEFGATGLLVSEILKQMISGAALTRFVGDPISGNGSTTVNTVVVNKKHPLVSAVSMIAPSPDWIVGVHGFSLCNKITGRWIDKKTADLFPYDAGTDSAKTFLHENEKTTPPETIRRITHTEEGSFKSDQPIKRMGFFTFVKTYDSTPKPKPKVKAAAAEPKRSSKPHSTSSSSVKPTEHLTSTVVLKAQPSSSAGPIHVTFTSARPIENFTPHLEKADVKHDEPTVGTTTDFSSAFSARRMKTTKETMTPTTMMSVTEETSPSFLKAIEYRKPSEKGSASPENLKPTAIPIMSPESSAKASNDVIPTLAFTISDVSPTSAHPEATITMTYTATPTDNRSSNTTGSGACSFVFHITHVIYISIILSLLVI